MKQIPLTQGKIALVDDEDFQILNQFTWYAKKKEGGKRFYAMRAQWFPEMRKQEIIFMHRFILGIDDPNVMIDHRDGDGLNNQRKNLRPCTNSKNQHNSRLPVDNTSGYKGVNHHHAIFKSNTKIWEARISVNGKRIRLGFFDTAEKAARAYDEAAKQYYGDFALLNFPNS